MKKVKKDLFEIFSVSCRKPAYDPNSIQDINKTNLGRLVLTAIKQKDSNMSSFLTGRHKGNGSIYKAHVSYKESELPKGIQLKGAKYEAKMIPKLILEFPLDAIQGEKREWLQLAEDYYKSQLDKETYTSGEKVTNITFGQAKANNGEVSQRKPFIDKRNKWLKKQYKILRRTHGQDICYELIKKKLLTLGKTKPQFFGEWYWYKTTKESDPFTLNEGTIKKIVHHRLSSEIMLPDN